MAGSGSPRRSSSRRANRPMNNLNRILVPVDFSEPSAEAVKYAASLGAAEVHLLHVLTPRPLDFAMIEPREGAPRRAELAIQELARFRARVDHPVDLRVRLAEGDAAAEIIRYV